MLGYLSADIICPEKGTVFRERSSRETVSFEEQIMSKDKYPNICLRQMETFVFIILQIFFATRAVLKIGEYPRIFLSFSWGIFGHVTYLDQWPASENIWWIITATIPCFTTMVSVCVIFGFFIFILFQFYKTVIPPAVDGYNMIIANSALRASLAVHYLISHARSWNNC